MSEKNTNVLSNAQFEDSFQNTFFELERSHEYADEDLYPTGVLEQKGRYWMQELSNPDRSGRAKRDIATILDRIAVEVSLRNGLDVRTLEAMLTLEAA